MSYKRWYDKDDNLRTIMESLKKLDNNARNAFALDIIQSALSRQTNKDNFLEILNEGVPHEKNRWYDDNEVLQSATMMLKYLPADEIQELFKDLIISLMCGDENLSRD